MVASYLTGGPTTCDEPEAKPSTDRLTRAVSGSSELPGLSRFVAIDFETANEQPNSACAIAAVRVEDGRIATICNVVLKVRTKDFRFSTLHGIDAECSMTGMDFIDVWPEIASAIEACGRRVVAHNAKFDRRVLESCARRAGIKLPRILDTCSRNLAESVWGLRPADLSTVCTFLSIPLRHHEPLSDATAAARIVIEAEREKLKRLATEVQS